MPQLRKGQLPGGPGGYIGGRPKDESKLRDDPKQIRVRLRRAVKQDHPAYYPQIKRDLEMLYRKPVEEWDIEELAKGRPRNRHGQFSMGPRPKWVTPIIMAEAKRRLMTETFGELGIHVPLAVKTIVDLLESEEVDWKGRPLVDARTKLAAATFIIENVIGKPKALVEVETTDLTRQALAAAIILDDGDPQDMPVVLEGEFTDNDDE